jgi:hypothetical protein
MSKSVICLGERVSLLAPFLPRVVVISPALESFERFPHERRVSIHTFSEDRRGDFLAVEVTQSSHDVRCDRKLNASC